METEIVAVSEQPTRSKPETLYSPAGVILSILSGVIGLGAVVCVGYGLHTVYAYESVDKVVGGDAYNFIILGLRGLAWVCCGIFLSLISGFCLFIVIRKR